MTFRFWKPAFVLFATFILAGCISVPMQEARFTPTAEPQQALVTFVRESVYLGDAVPLNLWDGDTFIGALTAGSLVQYQAAPGQHVFMASSENWAYVKSDLKPGKHYVIKANIFPGFMMARAALVPVESTDKRLGEWPTKLKVKAIDPAKKDKYIQKQLPRASAALQKSTDEGVKVFEMTEQHAR